MAVKIGIQYSQSISVNRDLPSTFQYLANAETSIPANFPSMEAFEKVKPDTYRWVFKKLSYGGMELQIKLVTALDSSASNRIKLIPVQAPGTTPGSFSGEWRLTAAGAQTQISFNVNLETELPIPFFLKSVAGPVAQKEIAKIFDRYLANVAKALA